MNVFIILNEFLFLLDELVYFFERGNFKIKFDLYNFFLSKFI